MRKIFLLVYIVMIAVFSISPTLLVTDPSTWIQKPMYVDELHLSFLFSFESEFYEPYGLIRDSTEFMLRKIGHFITYAGLAIIFFANLRQIRLRYRFLYSWLLASFVGFADEINQYFNVDRDGRLIDVALDSSAALIAVTVITIIFRLRDYSNEIG